MKPVRLTLPDRLLYPDLGTRRGTLVEAAGAWVQIAVRGMTVWLPAGCVELTG